jgi:hypothetical protein
MKLYYVEYLVWGKERYEKGEAIQQATQYDVIVEADDLITAGTRAVGSREKTELRVVKYIGCVGVRQPNRKGN